LHGSKVSLLQTKHYIVYTIKRLNMKTSYGQLVCKPMLTQSNAGLAIELWRQLKHEAGPKKLACVDANSIQSKSGIIYIGVAGLVLMYAAIFGLAATPSKIFLRLGYWSIQFGIFSFRFSMTEKK